MKSFGPVRRLARSCFRPVRRLTLLVESRTIPRFIGKVDEALSALFAGRVLVVYCEVAKPAKTRAAAPAVVLIALKSFSRMEV